MHVLPNWCRGTLIPDEVIGEHEMLRWWVLPRNRWFNVFVHKHQANDPRFLHDHPADNLSIRLCGELVEYTPEMDVQGIGVWVCRGRRTVFFPLHSDTATETCRRIRRFRFRRAEQPHRLALPNGRPAWTLWIRFRNRRKWGFYERSGWRPARTARQPG